MQAEKMSELKSSLVSNILENIQNLYFKLHIDEADNINRRFIALYEDGDINKLKDFNEQLNICLLYTSKKRTPSCGGRRRGDKKNIP